MENNKTINLKKVYPFIQYAARFVIYFFLIIKMAIDFFYNLFKTGCVFQANLSAQLLSRNRRKRRKWNAKGGKKRRKREERTSHHYPMVETGGPGAGHRTVAVLVAV